MSEQNDQLAFTEASQRGDEASSTQQGPWILNWGLPHNAFWRVGVFRLVVLIGLLFYLLLTLSMLL